MYKNAVNLIGFLGKDSEVKAAQDNSTNFTVLSLAMPSQPMTRSFWRRSAARSRSAVGRTQGGMHFKQSVETIGPSWAVIAAEKPWPSCVAL